MSKATTSNKVVSLDLKEFKKENKHVLYMVDEFSGYMKGEVINNKKPETIIKAFNKVWIEEGPGIPSKGTMTDNEGEFKNQEYKGMASKYGLKISLTAGNSPWSNGKCERNHYSTDRTIQKLREENPHMSLQDALSAAIHVHNLQVNKTGFSPRQVTFGQQGIVPGIKDGNPATMEPSVDSDAVRKLLIYRQKAEEIYRQIDSSERIQKAMAQQSYGYQDSIYKAGDSVFYKEEGKDRWAGPAKVTGVEGNKVRVIHSGYDRTVPKCRVMPAEERQDIIDEDLAENVGKEATIEKEKDVSKNKEHFESESEASDDYEEESTVLNRNKLDIRPKRNQEIKYTSNGETFAGKVVKVGKPNSKDRFHCWIKKKDGDTINIDFNKDVDCWKPIKRVVFDKSDIKVNDKDKQKGVENDHLGVYFLKN